MYLLCPGLCQFIPGWLFSDERFVSCLTKVQFWFRFIDYLLSVWTGSREELLVFLDALNDNNFNLKFTHTFYCRDWKWPYCNRHITSPVRATLLHAHSSHPAPLIRSIPYAQNLHICRNCSSEKLFSSIRSFTIETDGEYSKNLLRKAFNKARIRPRTELLFITRFSAHERPLRSSISNNWNLLAKDYTLSK